MRFAGMGVLYVIGLMMILGCSSPKEDSSLQVVSPEFVRAEGTELVVYQKAIMAESLVCEPSKGDTLTFLGKNLDYAKQYGVHAEPISAAFEKGTDDNTEQENIALVKKIRTAKIILDEWSIYLDEMGCPIR